MTEVQDLAHLLSSNLGLFVATLANGTLLPNLVKFMEQARTNRVRLGGFELDLRTGELYAVGTAGGDGKILLREQPFQVLRMLVDRKGKIVTREEIKRKLWPNDTIVDFDHSINVAIGTLRRALGDSANNPQYIETLARRGYRLCVAIEWVETTHEVPLGDAASPPALVELGGLIGKKVSHYRVLEVIGGGGMGMVYKAEDLKLSRPVALKFLPEELASDPIALQRFEREAQTASALNHPNICTIYEIEEYEGKRFIAMELLEGDTLLHRVNKAKQNANAIAALLDIAIQICNGLQAAHDKDIIHRDIKPANIFLTKEGVAKILDFGLAKLVAGHAVEENEGAEESPVTHPPTRKGQAPSEKNDAHPARLQADLTRTGTTAGTAAYMSPEQVRKEKLDARTDLFSFGLVLYEMVAGRRAFDGDTIAEVNDAILSQTPAPAHDLNYSVPRKLDVVIKKALEKDRSRRYQSVAEMREDIERVRKELQPARRRARRWLAAAGLISVLAAAFWFYQSYRNRVTLSNTDTIVLADISNQTGDPGLDDALNAALRYSLEQTPYIDVLAIDKVLGTLRLLNLPPDTRVTPEIAGQISLRTNSKMVIASSIADAGNRFYIELNAIDGQSGTPVARLREDAASRNEIVHVLGDLAAQLRRKLGEPSASLARFNKPLEEATSSSLDALQAGREGYKHHIAGDVRGAIPYYQHAIELDPDFGLAYQAIAAANDSRGEHQLAMGALKKAYELRNRMTEPTRFRAECRYYESVTGETEKACLVALQAVQTFPRDAVAHTNLASYLGKLGQPDRAADEAREAARLLPSPYSYHDLVLRSINADRLNEAKAAFDAVDARHFDSADLRVYRVLLAFLQHDRAAMEEQWSWAAGKPDADRFLFQRAIVECYYGHFRNSRLLSQQAIDMGTKAGTIPWYGIFWSVEEAEVGNSERARSGAAQALKSLQKRHDQIYLALAFARAGNVEEAQKLADALDQEYPLDTAIQYYYLPTIRAAIKLNENDPASAVEILRPALKYDLAYPDSFQSLYPAYIRGLAYLQMGDGQQAAAEFQKLLDHPGLVGRDVHGALSHLQLARAQKLMGDEAASRKSYEDFLTLWKDADPDIPIYQQAKAEYAKLTRP